MPSIKMYPPDRNMGIFKLCFTLFVIVVVINGIECGKHRNKGQANTSHAIQQHMLSRGPVAEKETNTLNKEKICIGTNGRLSVPSNRDRHYRNLKDRYTNCTYVDGNLELTWLQEPNQDLSFLQSIREVTGYVLISHVDVKKVVLPNLQIIRGRNVFLMNIANEEFTLIVTMSKMMSLELPALRDVLKGDVGFLNNYNLCHIKTINWKEIISDGNFSYVYNFTSPERQCPACDRECENGCWGEGKKNCQQFSKVFCSPQCAGGRCFGTKPRECCHLFCAGGCTGPTQSDCIACVNFYDDGVCTQECPPMQIYNPSTYSWEPNPAGKYAYGATCVKKCPEHLLKDNGACVRTCPANKHAKNGECVPCEGPCPKPCTSDGTIHYGNINSFRNCTVLEGNINILQTSLNGYQHVYDNFTFGERYPPMHPSALEVFSSLKQITGYLNIQAYHPDFKNLSCFRNLEEIGGRTLYEYSTSLYIVKTSLESLELSSLKTIKMGTVAILENQHLCLAEGINWKSLQKSNESHLMLSNNSDSGSCKKRGLVCDSQCSDDGCWSPGPNQCLSCLNYRLGRTCLQNCNVKPGLYRASTNECKPCHEQCGSSCHGPGADNCTSCKHLRDGNFCVSKCMLNKYEEHGFCQQCHQNCVESCTGPSNVLGKGGCDACQLAIIKENNYVCLNRKDTCPDGYYFEYIGPHSLEGSNPNTTAVCRKCHPRCKKCTQYGFHKSICQECTHFKKGEQCEDECTPDYYPDVTTNECISCDKECRGCTGPGPDNCIQCQSTKFFADGYIDLNSTKFTCVTTCPIDYPYRLFSVDANAYCSNIASSSMLASEKHTSEMIIIIVGVIVGVCILVLLAGFFYYCQRKEKLKENAMKMTLALTGLEDDEPLRPTNVMPNIAKLRIIKETELRKSNILGCGAFGKVYQGVWNLEGEGHNSAKIPVAIKVLREDTGANTSKDFLDEAYIMATVDHPNLLQLLGVCMTSQMMLITQLMYLGCLLDFVRNNKDRIGSKTFLNWSTQIARGMAYLEEKRLVHRDLAARNVLLQTPGLVKITDFGLAKLLDINEEEYKAAGGKMPIKWLALECIQHRIFTHKSDVWAFGVTVWELLTFGDRPYDNVPARDVPELLEKGERLPQPEIASIEVYMILIKCWMLDAESRPCFKELEEDFSKMAQDPGRYLAIPGDKFMRLTNFPNPQNDREIVRSLASVMESSHSTFENDNHLQPKSRAPLHASLSDSSSSQNQNHLNQKLLRYAQSHGFDSSVPTQSDASSIKYCGSLMKMRDDIGSDEYDSVARSQAKVGTLKLDLPVDEDDYLMPSPQQGQGITTYVDLIDSKSSDPSTSYTNYQDFYKNNIDNPEYLMNNDTPSQTVGLPTVSEFVNASSGTLGQASGFKPPQMYLPQKSTEEESDHEYYNDFDRLQRELQPLQKNINGAIV
ncbi:epidermal growth factor receptor isoform X1 [Diorhabda carinulata]|uniref:epidermal growth factor receptor isoform X1 n=1 Tax=Diorhabda carinulata TaxID=1163345 RepID=UPI0025A310B2|nr:epidermal growth factor receptor isoform X1 [Diorhabda carinulata]XP_057671891.1 epidermal growth factor receptor isoform X1 [Diorhabda carinulata]